MTAARTRPARVSLWRQILAQCGPGFVAIRYVTLVRLRARSGDPHTFAGSAREDAARLATAVKAVLTLHTPDTRHRCQACSAGPHLVDWPCRTSRAVEDGLRHGWPTPTDIPEPADVPGPHEGFALAVLAVHDILPAAGRQPAHCRTCHTPPDDCPVWALAEGFLGITWTDPAARPVEAAVHGR